MNRKFIIVIERDEEGYYSPMSLNYVAVIRKPDHSTI
jgi:hypothetical protein